MLLLLGAWLLARAWQVEAGVRWGLMGGFLWLYLAAFLRRRLDRNRRQEDGKVLDRWGPGTWLSLMRALAISGLAGFLLQPRPPGLLAWLPMALYTLSDVADYFDGYLARRSGYATLLGVDLDLELDALGLLVAVTVVVQYGTLPLIFLPVGLARYGYALLVGMRERRGLPVHELPPSLMRRPIAGVTMGFISATLWPIVDRPEATLAALVFTLPFAAGFVRDGLVVSGQLHPEDEFYQRWRRRLRSWALDKLPLLLRVAFVLAAGAESVRLLHGTAAFESGWTAWGVNEPARLAAAFVMLYSVGGLALLLGWAGRLIAFLLIFPVGLTIAATSMDATRAALLFAVLSLMLTGTGRWSLWKPSDRWFRRRAGEQLDRSDDPA